MLRGCPVSSARRSASGAQLTLPVYFMILGTMILLFRPIIAGQGTSVEHSTAGTQVLCDMAEGPDKAMAKLIAYAVLGHHAGLPDRDNAVGGSFSLRMEQPLRIADAWQKELGDDVSVCHS